MRARPSVARAVALLRADPELADRVLLLACPESRLPRIGGAADAALLVGPLLVGRPCEALVGVALSARASVLGCEVLTSGSDRATVVDPRQILRWALTVGVRPATSLIVAHNHPSGDPEPSREDIAATRVLSAACSAVGVRLVDHLVWGEVGRWVSLAERGVCGGAS